MALANLPSELLILVQSFLTPLDILFLQLTNRTVRIRASCRVVWRDALRRVIEENVIFGPTFDLQTMSTEDLRYAALRPQLFMKRVQRRPWDAQNLGWPVSQSEFALDLDSRDDVFELHVVQGGRFVLVDSRLAFRVYSLEDRADMATSLEPVLSINKGEEDQEQEADTLPRECALGLHAVIGDEIVFFFSCHADRATNSPASLVAYKVTGLGAGSFREDLAMLSLPRQDYLSACHFCAADRRLAFVGCDSNLVGVWDYEQNQVALMRIPADGALTYSTACILTHNSVIVQTPGALSVFAIPPFTSILPPSQMVPPAAHPIKTCPIDGFKVHTSNQASVGFFDLHFSNGEGVFDRYRIDPASPNDPSSQLVPVLDSGGLDLRPEGGYDMTYCEAGTPRACVGKVFIMGYRTGWYDPDIEAQADRRDAYFSDDEWEPEDYTDEIDEAIGRENDRAGVFVHVEHRDQERDASESGRHPASIVELLDRSDAAWGQRELSFVDFCPASGRLCAVVAEDGPPRLLVFDYLPASM